MIPNKFQVPKKPGVYIFKNNKGQILYIGKAIDLYARVSSYFNGQDNRFQIKNLVSQIDSLETISVFSEIDALILEANLIKKYLPPFNIKLTDDKDYLYIKITKDIFPKVLTARKKELADAKAYFGPFPSGNTVRSTLKKLRRIFPWCAGGNHTNFLDNVIVAKTRPCFYYHLGLCPGPCAGKIDRKQYNKIINRLIKFLNGKKDQVIKDLEREMEQLSKQLDFEKAQVIKKTIDGITYLTSANNISVYLENSNFVEDQNKLALESLKKDLNLNKIPERIECFDISNISGQLAVGSMVVLTSGQVDKKSYRKFKIGSANIGPNDVAMLKEVIRRRIKHNEWPKPDLILVDGGRGQVRGAESETRNSEFNIPIFGLAKRLEWIYPPEGEIIKLSKSSLSLKLLQNIRDESHRFAISYHRKLRDNSLF